MALRSFLMIFLLSANVFAEASLTGGVLKETDRGPLLLLEGWVFPLSAPKVTELGASGARRVDIGGDDARAIFMHLWSFYSRSPGEQDRSYGMELHWIDGRGISCRRTPPAGGDLGPAFIDQSLFECALKQSKDGTTEGAAFPGPRARFTVTNGGSGQSFTAEQVLLNETLIQTYFRE